MILEILFLQVPQWELKNIHRWLIYQSKAISFYFGTRKNRNQNCDISVENRQTSFQDFKSCVCSHTKFQKLHFVCLFPTEISQQTHLTDPPPFRAFFAKIRGEVSPLPFFPIEKKRSFTGKKPKFFFAFGEIRGAVRWVCCDLQNSLQHARPHTILKILQD